MSYRAFLGCLHIAALLFGLTGVFGKLANTASPEIIVFGRAAFAVLALVLLARCTGPKLKRMSAPDVCRQLLGGMLWAAHCTTFFIAVKVGGVAIATLGFASFPAFTVILESLLFRERIRRVEAVLVLIVTVGLVLVTPDFDLGNRATVGLLWALLAGLLFSVLSLNNRAGSGRLPAVQTALCQNLVMGLLLLPFALPTLQQVAAVDWLWIALLGTICTAVAHSLFVASLAVIKARTAAMVFALEPVYGIAAAWIIFAEIPTLRMVLGGVLIILTILLFSRLSSEK